MDLETIIKENITAIIAVLGTLFGVLISIFSNWLIKKNEFQNQIKMKKVDFEIEFKRKNLIEPILMFLESDLKLTSILYSKGINTEEIKIQKQLSEHILDMSMVSARIRVYGNPTLNTKFEEFTRKRIDVGFRALSDVAKDINGAYGKIKEAELLASEIIQVLKDDLKKHKRN